MADQDKSLPETEAHGDAEAEMLQAEREEREALGRIVHAFRLDLIFCISAALN